MEREVKLRHRMWHDYKNIKERYKYTLLGLMLKWSMKWGLDHAPNRCVTFMIKASRLYKDRVCKICGAKSTFFAWRRGAAYFKCMQCSFIESTFHEGKDFYEEVYKNAIHTASKTSGGRELFFVEWCTEILGFSNPRILVFAPGSTLTFEILSERGADVYAADISDGLPYSDRFIHLRKSKMPEVKFDIITAVEVIEHFDNPHSEFEFLHNHLAQDGIIAGTTDFYQGRPIWNTIYLDPKDHISYFHRDSLFRLCSQLGMECALFEMEWSRRNRSVQNRRAFFIYNKGSKVVHEAIARQQRDCPILPIQRA